jgi:hypothetical protein
MSTGFGFTKEALPGYLAHYEMIRKLVLSFLEK